MRISTNTLYRENIATMNTLQAQLAQTQQQISTGKKILNPADDPIAAARAVELSQSDSANTQFATNRTSAINNLSLAETVLQGVTSLLQDVRLVALDAGNAMANDASRKAMARDLQGRLDELLGLANSTDGAGNYLFSGAQGNTQPFASTVAGVVYQGDDVQRKVQAAATRQIAASDTGSDIFMRIRNGNGVFQTSAAVGNTGDSVINAGTLINPALYTGQSYQLTFTVAAGVTTYSVNDVTAGAPGTPVLAAQPYVSGQAISVNGIQFEVKGVPANGDVFNVAPSSNQSVFTTMQNLINTLNTSIPSNNALAAAQYRQGLTDAYAAIDQSLNNVLGVRATMGARLRELDALQVTGEDLGLQYKQALSKIQDTDYHKAIADLSMQQMTLQAAQQSFAKISGNTLFNYL